MFKMASFARMINVFPRVENLCVFFFFFLKFVLDAWERPRMWRCGRIKVKQHRKKKSLSPREGSVGRITTRCLTLWRWFPSRCKPSPSYKWYKNVICVVLCNLQQWHPRFVLSEAMFSQTSRDRMKFYSSYKEDEKRRHLIFCKECELNANRWKCNTLKCSTSLCNLAVLRKVTCYQ